MSITVIEYTDAACPWAWSNEPMKWRLRWFYGEGLRCQVRMIGLTSDPNEFAGSGGTERDARAYAQLAERYGMPLETAPRPRLGATVPACRAVVAARLHAPAAEKTLLRRLRVGAMTRADAVLDDPGTIARAAIEAGIDPIALERWMADPIVERALAQDMQAARAPSRAAVALKHKLSAIPDGRWRYAAPSLVFVRDDGARVDVPGFQPSLAYEVAIANLVPDLERRLPPGSVQELLAWAGEPMATREVAEVMDVTRDEARVALEAAAGVVEQPVGTDAFWTLGATTVGSSRRAA